VELLDLVGALALGVGLGAITGMPLGVINVAIVDAVIAHEHRHARGLALGGALADATHTLLAYAGLGRLVTARPQYARWLAIGAAIAIIAFAIASWRRRHTARRSSTAASASAPASAPTPASASASASAAASASASAPTPASASASASAAASASASAPTPASASASAPASAPTPSSGGRTTSATTRPARATSTDSATTSPARATSTDPPLVRGILSGIALTLPNPAALAAWVAVAAMTWPDASIPVAVSMALGVGVGSAAWFSVLGRMVAKVRPDHRALRFVPKLALVVFVGIALVGVIRAV